MEIGERIVAAARGLAGTPFRLHGRSPATGVDCVGLALLSLRAAGASIAEPPPYTLRAGPSPPIDGWMRKAGFVAARQPRAGDIVVVRISMLQPHLVIDAGDRIVHAHAGLGRVVIMPMPDAWPELSRWRYHGVNS